MRFHLVLELVLASSVVKELNQMLIKLHVLNVNLDSILVIHQFVYLVLLDHSLEVKEQQHVQSVHLVIKPTQLELVVKLVLLVLIQLLELNVKLVSME